MRKNDPAFSGADLKRVLSERLGLAPDVQLAVAFSGGLDSLVLLHALAHLRSEMPMGLRALHVDHGLQAASGAWLTQVRQHCAQWQVPLVDKCVQVEQAAKQGVEAAARRARYGFFAEVLAPGEVLLTAHHQDDQAETVLLQLLRGAGVQGSAALGELLPFAAGQLARPLLHYRRTDLQAYAALHGLVWIDDPSNQDQRLRRNFLRHTIIPQLQSAWPQVQQSLARHAQHAADAALLLDTLAAEDLIYCRLANKNTTPVLSISALTGLAPARQRNLLRYWLRTQGFYPPSSAHLEELMQRLRVMPVTRHDRVRWSGAEVRRYRDGLYALAPLGSVPQTLSLAWDFSAPLNIPGTGRCLRAEAAVGAGIAHTRIGGLPVQVRLRQGGETCRLPGHAHQQALKKLLQEHAVPPWERARLPLVYVGDRLAAVADLWVCEPFAAHSQEPAWRLHWQQRKPAPK